MTSPEEAPVDEQPEDDERRDREPYLMGPPPAPRGGPHPFERDPDVIGVCRCQLPRQNGIHV